MTTPSICVYCGSRDGAEPAYAEAAEALGTALAGAGWRLVYGAGILIVLHVMWQAKEPWEAGREVVILVVLLGIRLPWVRRRVVEVRKALSGSGSGE